MVMGKNYADIVISLACFLDNNISLFLRDDGLIANEAWERISVELIDATNSSDTANEILQIFHRDANGSDILQQKTKTLLAEALAVLFFNRKNRLNVFQWLIVLDWFRIHGEFIEALKEEIAEDADLTPVEMAARDIFAQPEQLVFNSERDSFVSYINSWKEETNVSQLWLCGENSYFPFDYNAFIFPGLLLPDKIEKLADLCSLLKAPCLLYEFYAHCWRFFNNEKILLLLLEKAPLSNESDSNVIWNSSFVAPTLLHYLISKRLRVKTTDRLSQTELEEVHQFFVRIANILNKRGDGYFLAKNYLRYLAPRKHNNINLANLCMASIGEAFANQSDEEINKKQLVNLFPASINDIRKKFCQSGILAPKQNTSVCLEVISILQFSKDEEQTRGLLPFFEASLMFEDESLPVYEASPLLCHYDAAAIYLVFGVEQVVTKWENTWNLFAAARRRISYSYYDTMSVGLHSNMKFMLLIGSALLNLLYGRKAFVKMKSLWDKLWLIVKGYLQTKSGMMEDFYLDYAKILTVWHARYEKAKNEKVECPIIKENEQSRKDSEKLTYESTVCLIESLLSYPKLLILSVQCLQINHYLDRATLTGSQRKRLSIAINEALYYYKGIVNEKLLYETGEKCLARI